MITSFKIENYKNISSLQLDDFKRINLLIGDNNVGKTNILEALMLYASRFNLSELRYVLNNRGEDVSIFQGNQITNTLDTFLPLVMNHDAEILQSDGITLGTDMDTLSLKLMYRVFVQANNNRTISMYVPLGNAIQTNYKEIHRELVLVVNNINGEERPLLSLQQPLQTQFNFIANPIFPSKYVHCPSRSDMNMDVLWGHISMTPLEKYVLQALQIIEPEITQFNIVKDANNRVIPKVSVGGKMPVPIFAMGDGICHILNIILAMLNVRNGILLLDEIDSGLHFNKHIEMWKILTELSETLNIQIFATTHNQDCMRALALFSLEYEKESQNKPCAFYKLSKTEENALKSEQLTDYDAIISRIMTAPEEVR